MTLSNPDLWSRIRDAKLPYLSIFDHDRTPPGLISNFTEYLRREGNWTVHAAIRIDQEYRKFLYLKAVHGGNLAPPQSIDVAWHLHMGFAEDYRRFCDDIIGIKIQHNVDLSAKDRDAAYNRVVGLYRAEFGVPPGDVWPPYRDLGMVLSQNSLLSYPWFVVVWVPLLALVTVLVTMDDIGFGWIFLVAVTSFFVTAVHLDTWVSRPETIANCG